jgi:hypothetical protein
MQEDFLYSQYCIGLSDISPQNHRNMAGTTNLQKKIKFSRKKYMFSILKLKNSYTHWIFFFRDRQKFQAALKLLENIPEYTIENKIKSNKY